MNGQPPLLRASALAPLATDGVGVEAHRHDDVAALRAWCRRLATPAAMQTGLLYPLNLLLEWLLPPLDVLGLRALLHLAAILVGTFLFARTIGLSRGAALLSAIAFGLSLPVVVWLEHPIAGAIAWLP